MMSSWSKLDLFKYIIYYIHILYSFIVLIMIHLDIIQIFLFLMSFGFV